MSLVNRCWVWIFICGSSASLLAADDVSSSLMEKLSQARLSDAETWLTKTLTTEPQHRQARFALGVVKVLSAIEQLGQSQYRYGAFNDIVRTIPVFRMPVPVNPDPQPVTYAQIRQVFVDLQKRLTQAEQELAKIDVAQDVKLALDLDDIQLDLNGDGKSIETESFLQILGVVNRRRPGNQPPMMRIVFDSGDVPWLRGYCHFVAGFCDVFLAYDHERLFDNCGRLMYPKYKPLVEPAVALDLDPDNHDARLLDVIAAVHLINFPVKEAPRMESARQHFLQMIHTSRQSWELILKETDNDHEWLPNPRQTGILGIPVTKDIIDGWHAVLQEMEDLLEGKALVPFWRDYFVFMTPQQKDIPAEGRGINLKRFFQKPRDFDLILTIQGSSFLPYIEEGRLSHQETWDNLTRVFHGQFFGFAMWFN